MLFVLEPQITFAPIKISPRAVPLTDTLPETTIFLLCLLVLSLIMISRLFAPGCLLVSSPGETQCSLNSISAKTDDLKTPDSTPFVGKDLYHSDKLLVRASGIRKHATCGFPVFSSLLCLCLLHWLTAVWSTTAYFSLSHVSNFLP